MNTYVRELANNTWQLLAELLDISEDSFSNQSATLFNPFRATALFLYRLKTSGKLARALPF